MNAEVGERRRNNCGFRMRRSFWRPVIRDGLGAINPIAMQFCGGAREIPEIGTDILPDDFALWRDLKEAAIVTFID